VALALIVIGLVVALLLNVTVGIVLIVIGAILLFVPAAPGGWHR
jgi:hypothetical protein